VVGVLAVFQRLCKRQWQVQYYRYREVLAGVEHSWRENVLDRPARWVCNEVVLF
jgi:hypothetical protein